MFFDTTFSKILLVNSGNIETNPDPRKFSPIKFCHWNLNGLAAHDFIKVPLLEAFISTHNFDILCLSETFLSSTIDFNDGNININGYSILRADHPSNNKRRGGCIYFKQSLPLIRRDVLSMMQEVIGDFNAKCSKWCSSDNNNIAALEIDNITTTAGYCQLINKPTHFINGNSSCIDLIFSSNVSFTRNYGIEQSI